MTTETTDQRLTGAHRNHHQGETALYRHYDAHGDLLYVGISLSALNRLKQHMNHSHWCSSIVRVNIQKFDSREEALEAERNAIISENPKHNIKHKRSLKSECSKTICYGIQENIDYFNDKIFYERLEQAEEEYKRYEDPHLVLENPSFSPIDATVVKIKQIIKRNIYCSNGWIIIPQRSNAREMMTDYYKDMGINKIPVWKWILSYNKNTEKRTGYLTGITNKIVFAHIVGNLAIGLCRNKLHMTPDKIIEILSDNYKKNRYHLENASSMPAQIYIEIHGSTVYKELQTYCFDASSIKYRDQNPPRVVHDDGTERNDIAEIIYESNIFESKEGYIVL